MRAEHLDNPPSPGRVESSRYRSRFLESAIT